MNAAQADAAKLVATARQRVVQFFDIRTDVDATVIADFESTLDDYHDAVTLAARADALAEFVAELNDRLDKAVTL